MDGKKDYPIQIGDKTYLFRYNFAALALIEDMSNAMTGNLRSLQVLVYAGVRQNHPTVTFEDVPGILDNAETLQSVSESVKDAIDSFTPKKKPAMAKAKSTTEN